MQRQTRAPITPTASHVITRALREGRIVFMTDWASRSASAGYDFQRVGLDGALFRNDCYKMETA